MICTHHTEHWVRDMKEQSLSCHSATLCVTACLPAWDSTIMTLSSFRKKQDSQSEPFVQLLFVKWSVAVLITVARQHQVWNEPQFPWGSLWEISAIARSFAGFCQVLQHLMKWGLLKASKCSFTGTIWHQLCKSTNSVTCGNASKHLAVLIRHARLDTSATRE